MNEAKIWIRTEDPVAEVQQYILSLFKESEEYAGNIRVVVYNPNSKKSDNINHIYDVSQMAVNVLKEHYGDLNIKVTGQNKEGNQKSLDCIADSLEKIVNVLERLDDTLGCINTRLRIVDNLADDLAECVVDSPGGKRFCIAGSVTAYEG
nr:MAG TPA: hypothetical protein [Caudoviricetes sp.]